MLLSLSVAEDFVHVGGYLLPIFSPIADCLLASTCFFRKIPACPPKARLPLDQLFVVHVPSHSNCVHKYKSLILDFQHRTKGNTMSNVLPFTLSKRAKRQSNVPFFVTRAQMDALVIASASRRTSLPRVHGSTWNALARKELVYHTKRTALLRPADRDWRLTTKGRRVLNLIRDRLL